MLQKGFFMTEPFNPDPYWTNPIVNLSGAQSFEQNTVFIPGVYLVDVQAGTPYVSSSYGSPVVGCGGRIQTEVSVSEPFIIRAYCGSRGTSTAGGINPYSGAFKVNSVTSNVSVPTVNHIFGNAGSFAMLAGAAQIGAHRYSSGNCLGNGAVYNGSSIGAGSCLHLLPVDGVFGTDYLFAFHCVSGTFTNGRDGGGIGSAYGGAGSGTVYSSGGGMGSATTLAGGSTPYGSGGAAHTTTSGLILGSNGTGAGYGYGGGVSANGGGAWFNGTAWVDSRDTGNRGEDGHIIVKYVGPLQ